MRLASLRFARSRFDSAKMLEAGGFRMDNCDIEERGGGFEDEELLLEKLQSVSNEEVSERSRASLDEDEHASQRAKRAASEAS